MRLKKILALTISSAIILQSSQALADGKDLAIGLGLGLLLNEIGRQGQNNGARRHRSDELLGPVGGERTGKRTKTPQQIAQEEAKRLRVEAERAEVADIQSRLNMLNFSAGDVDGRPGNQTTSAIRAFQQSLGHPQTGSLTAEQKAMLVASTSPSVAPANANSGQNVPGLTEASGQPPAAMAPITTANNDPFANATPLLPRPGNLDIGPSASPPQTGPTSDAGAAQGQEAVDVFGVYPGMKADQAQSALKNAMGADGCNATATSIVCVLASQTMNDQVVVGITAPDDGALVHTVIRTVKLQSPVPRAGIEKKMRETYPTLVSAPDSVAASGEQCVSAAQILRANDFSALRDWVQSGQPPL